MSTPTRSQNAPQGSHGPRTGFSGRIFRLALKELRETLRDRRTIVTLVLMPILVYPLLSFGFQKLMLTSFAGSEEATPEYYIGIESQEAEFELNRSLTAGHRLLTLRRKQAEKSRRPPKGSPPSGDQAKQEVVNVVFPVLEDLEQGVADGKVDIGVRFRPLQTNSEDGSAARLLQCELIFRDDRLSRKTLDFVEQRLRALNDQIARRPASSELRRKQVAASKSGIGVSLAAVIPLILILMTITGAVYPAIDLTAGERERGTLETLIAAPVPRLGLLVAKYIAVLTVALLTATVNLAAMTVTVYSIGLSSQLFGETGLTFLAIVQVFGLLFLFAAFFSAVLLSITSFARSFKEAQAYLIPVMLLSIAPGLLSLNESLELSGMTAVVPLLNIVLLGRDLFSGAADSMLAVVVVLSTILYSIAALTVAAQLFGADAILYGSHGTWSEVFRRPGETQPVASVSSAMLCVAVLFPSFFVLQGFIAQATNIKMSVLLCVNSLTLAVLFGALPLAVALLRRVHLAGAFGFQRANLLGFFGALVLGLSLWPLMFELVIAGQLVGIGNFSADLVEIIKDMLGQWKQLPIPLVLIAMAVVPALFEELFFRGFLYRSLAARTSARNAILVSALMFGLFHIFVPGGLSTVRLLPSTCMGVILGWVCYQTGSVLPGMLLHICHNATTLLISYRYDDLDVTSLGIEQQEHLDFSWILAAIAATSVGALLLLASGRQRRLTKADEGPLS